MKKHLKKSLSVAVAAGVLGFAGTASALDTQVAFSTTGDGNYDVTGISSLDHLDDGSFLVEQTLVSSSNGATTLNQFFAIAAVGDTLTFDLHVNTIVEAFSLGGAGGGTPVSGGEFTAVLSAVETATVLIAGASPTIQFTGATGSYAFYWDDGTGVAADRATGAGFNDGDVVFSGSINGSTGFFSPGIIGSTSLTSSIDFYDPNYIEADNPLCTVPGTCLIGTEFASLVEIDFAAGAQPLLNGGRIGVDQHVALLDGSLQADFLASHDSNTEFTRAVPTPGTMVLMGAGLLGLALRRRKV